ncbi:MAG: pantoate--beta-alanine ligase [Phycisphaerales bacterium]|nr:pantoate--beta-alanine ligase [Phycisphaerales bacterium]
MKRGWHGGANTPHIGYTQRSSKGEYLRRMQIVEHAESLAPLHGWALVPTMGALHAGHASLIQRAVGDGRPVVVSLFVNPTQFAAGEDFSKYPRTLEADRALCQAAGAAAIFIPSVQDMYPHGVDAANAEAAHIELPLVATQPKLEDAQRPTHFAGVCQVVAKLFDMCQPAAAYFGEKDFQQLRVIQDMARREGARWKDLVVHACPTIRESDGLAISSRNHYLRANQRENALGLSRALAVAQAGALAGMDIAAAESEMRRVLARHQLKVEYAVIRAGDTLLSIEKFQPILKSGARALIAARLENVRLIDNASCGGA